MRNVEPEAFTPHTFDFVGLCSGVNRSICISNTRVNAVRQEFFVLFDEIVGLVWPVFDYEDIKQCPVHPDFLHIDIRESILEEFMGIVSKQADHVCLGSSETLINRMQRVVLIMNSKYQIPITVMLAVCETQDIVDKVGWAFLVFAFKIPLGSFCSPTY